MPPPPPELCAELIEEVLLRFPPDEPARLAHATLVCKLWHRIVSDIGFRHRYCALHGTPLMVGVICNRGSRSELAPTSTFCPRHATTKWPRNHRALDARHGRVLTYGYAPLHYYHTRPHDGVFVIWNPITNKRRELPKLSEQMFPSNQSWNMAVLCAASLNNSCDHLDCHRKGAFLAVLVGTSSTDMFSYVYSSEIDAWGEKTTTSNDMGFEFDLGHSALVGNALYFLLRDNRGIVKYSLETREMSVIDLPEKYLDKPMILVNMEDSGLGFATLVDSNRYLSLRKVGPDGEGLAPTRVIDLQNLLPFYALLKPLDLIGYADSIGVIFLWTCSDGIFTVNLKSSRVNKIFRESRVRDMYPCMSFYS